MRKYQLQCIAFSLVPLSIGGQLAYAQEDHALKLDYNLTTEMAVGSGKYTAYQLVANQHDALSHKSNTGYLRADIRANRQLTDDWQLSGAVDVIASANAAHSFYLQQCYVNLQWQNFYLEAGAKEHHPVLRDAQLSSGALISSGNAKPLPEVRLGTDGFWTVPGTNRWLQIYLDASYGHFLDSDWQEERFDDYLSNHYNSFVTTDVWYHQKKLYFRSDPFRKWSFTLGIEHAVQFGGQKVGYETGQQKVVNTSPSLGDFFHVIIPQSDGSPSTDAGDSFVYGNHLGSWTLQLDWNLSDVQQVSAYLDNPFDDGSGIRKGNRWDGLWGLEYHNRTKQTCALRGIVMEYLCTQDQSGSIHWAPGDFVATGSTPYPHPATGNDNYYNNFFYNGYAHYGQTMGNGLLMSPIYNEDCYPGFVDNRVKAWHLAVTGDVTTHLYYLVRGSYREGLGTFFVPLNRKHHSLDAMARLGYHCGSWHYSAAFGISQGNIYGDCTTFDLKISYHGKIL